jgi:hypothetical protein
MKVAELVCNQIAHVLVGCVFTTCFCTRWSLDSGAARVQFAAVTRRAIKSTPFSWCSGSSCGDGSGSTRRYTCFWHSGVFGTATTTAAATTASLLCSIRSHPTDPNYPDQRLARNSGDSRWVANKFATSSKIEGSFVESLYSATRSTETVVSWVPWDCIGPCLCGRVTEFTRRCGIGARQ